MSEGVGRVGAGRGKTGREENARTGERAGRTADWAEREEERKMSIPKTSKELAHAIEDDRKYKEVDAAKKRAVAQRVDYDTFKNMVSVAHLRPLQAPDQTIRGTHGAAVTLGASLAVACGLSTRAPAAHALRHPAMPAIG